jgi:hypothetical protein
MTGRVGVLLNVPLLRRVAWHFRRARSQLDRRTVLAILGLLVGIVFVAALIVTLLEKPWTLKALADSFYEASRAGREHGSPRGGRSWPTRHGRPLPRAAARPRDGPC